MRPGQGGASWERLALAGLGLVLLAGCGASRAHLEKALLTDHNPAAHARDIEAYYPVHCPDVLDIQVAGRPSCCGSRRVGADGRITLADGATLRVDGLAPPAVGRAVARWAEVPAEKVSVHVAEHNSQFLYLFGEVSGLQRAIPYRGPETVLDLLQRAGGLTPGAAPADVRVVRGHIADGKPPEVFHVDLRAILLKRDQQTNIRLEPFDQVHVGQTHTSSFRCCVPPWLRPVYERVCGIKRTAAPQATSAEPRATAPSAVRSEEVR
jgi:protein involved in polysaccharide export with SLBB domain